MNTIPVEDLGVVPEADPDLDLVPGADNCF